MTAALIVVLMVAYVASASLQSTCCALARAIATDKSFLSRGILGGMRISGIRRCVGLIVLLHGFRGLCGSLG